MSPLFEDDVLPLTLSYPRALNRIASGLVMKVPSKKLSQFSEAKTSMSSLFWDKSWIGALKAGQIGVKSVRIALIPQKIIGIRLFPYLNG